MKYKRNKELSSHLPGYNVLYDSRDFIILVLGKLFPKITKMLSPYNFYDKFASDKMYQGKGLYKTSSSKFVRVFIRDADLIKSCNLSKQIDKPIEIFKATSFLGPNVLVTKVKKNFFFFFFFF